MNTQTQSNGDGDPQQPIGFENDLQSSKFPTETGWFGGGQEAFSVGNACPTEKGTRNPVQDSK